jgi:hypothetical protein
LRGVPLETSRLIRRFFRWSSQIVEMRCKTYKDGMGSRRPTSGQGHVIAFLEGQASRKARQVERYSIEGVIKHVAIMQVVCFRAQGNREGINPACRLEAMFKGFATHQNSQRNR